MSERFADAGNVLNHVTLTSSKGPDLIRGPFKRRRSIREILSCQPWRGADCHVVGKRAGWGPESHRFRTECGPWSTASLLRNGGCRGLGYTTIRKWIHQKLEWTWKRSLHKVTVNGHLDLSPGRPWAEDPAKTRWTPDPRKPWCPTSCCFSPSDRGNLSCSNRKRVRCVNASGFPPR